MDGFPIGWRDGVLVLVALAAIYLVLMLVKLMQLGRSRLPEGGYPPETEQPDGTSPPSRAQPPVAEEPRMTEPVDSVAARDALAAYAEAMQETPRESFAVRPAPTFEWDDVKELFGEEMEVPTPAEPAARTAPSGFGEPLSAHLARNDVEAEMQRMREEMERMRREVEDLRVARRVSPQYAEAMELARRGLTAQEVADQLGISLAEAELVQALSHGRQNFEEGETNGAEGDAGGSGGQRTRYDSR